MKYTVARQHFGERMYMPGDEREADESDVRHLIANGILQEPGKAKKATKATKAPENK